MKVENINIGELKPFERNPKSHPAEQIDRIVRSIQEFGFTNPILAFKENNMIIAGHARLKAAQKMNLAQVPVIFLDMPYEKAIAYVVADNRLAELAEWDNSMLLPLLDEIKLSGIDVELTGFTTADISLMNKQEVQEDDFDAGAAADAIKEPVTKIGDIWILGRHRLLCGDSTKREDVEKLMDGKKADMVFTDPPYGIDYSGGRTQVVAKKTYGKIKGDASADISNFIKTIIEQAGNKDYYICLSPINLKDAVTILPKYEGVIVWKKQTPGLGYQWVRRYCEFILFNTKRVKHKTDDSIFDFWDIPTDPKTSYIHGTQKPVEVPGRAIRFSSVIRDIILDSFGGSGSTLIACEQLDRICYMMEIDPIYCDVIVQRWEKFTGQKAHKLEVTP